MVTQARIIEWYKRFDGNVFVSFSGGKDSTVLLDLARRVYPDIPAVYVDTGLEYVQTSPPFLLIRDLNIPKTESLLKGFQILNGCGPNIRFLKS